MNLSYNWWMKIMNRNLRFLMENIGFKDQEPL